LLLALIPAIASAMGAWSATGSLTTARSDHTATLVAGGYGSNGALLFSAEIYDPATGAWSATGSLNIPRYFHTATLRPFGRILVAGGFDGTATLLPSRDL
jgi:hypothetical protein